MARYLVVRLLGIVGVMLVISLLTFTLMHAIPGGPYDEEKMPLPPAIKQMSLAMAMYPRVAEVVPDFGHGSPRWWPRWSPSPGH